MARRRSQRLPVSTASVPAAAKTAACGIVRVRPLAPIQPHHSPMLGVNGNWPGRLARLLKEGSIMVSAWWLIVLVAAIPLTSSTQDAHIFNATLAEEGERRAEGAAKVP